MYIYKAGVVGLGAMGAEIAQVITFAGLPVVVKDANDEITKKGIEKIRKIYQRQIDKGKMNPNDVEAKMALVIPATSYKEFSDVDIVIEAVIENMEVKKQIFKELDESAQKTAIFATNTSSLSISEMASATKRPEKVIGMHFFNPAHVMKLVEVIPGLTTSGETVDDVISFSESLRKIPVRVKECPGFLVNRLLLPYLNEAAIALQEGSATAKEIDEAMVKFGMPMGPFTLMDMLGLDVSKEVANILYTGFGPRMKAAEIFDAVVKAERFGQKNGAGFYDYDERAQSKKPMNEILEEIRKQTGAKKTVFSENRLLLLMLIEAINCIQEQIASPTDIDMAMMAGTGFPQDKMGPLHWADSIGLDTVFKELEKFSNELGPRFWPPFLLKNMVSANILGVKTKKGFFSY